MINCNVEGFRVKTIIRDLQEDVKFWLNNWIDQWPGSGRRPEESGSWSDGSLVFSSWTRCGDVLTRPVTPIITSTTELFHRKLQKTNLLNKNIWKCCHRNYYHFVRVLWCDITIMRKLKPSSHDWRKMSSYGSNHWEGRVEGRGAACCWCLATRKYLTNIQTSVQTSDLQTTAKVNWIILWQRMGLNYVFWPLKLSTAGAWLRS